MQTVTQNGITIAIMDKTTPITSVQDVLDAIVTMYYSEHSEAMIVFKESLPERFFDLKSGFAGEVLQKFSNYATRLAIVGDFSGYTSKSLKDFIYECNKGKLIFFKSDLEGAISALS